MKVIGARYACCKKYKKFSSNCTETQNKKENVCTKADRHEMHLPCAAG